MNKPCANTLRPFKSSSLARPAAPRSRRSRAISSRAGLLAVVLALAALVPGRAFAATPAPHPASSRKPPARIDLTKIQPKVLLPKRAEHAEYIVDVNKYGQVSRVRTARGSDSPTFNAQTFGNAQQTFIRTPDGNVVVGSYRLTYDYDPKTERVRRDVSLVAQGGVNPNAKGAALVLMEKAQKQSAKQNSLHSISPNAGASVDPRNLPDLPSIGGPSPQPSPH